MQEKKDLLDFVLEKELKIDLLIDTYFDMHDLVRPSRESGEVWTDSIIINKDRLESIDKYYYKNDLILTVKNTGLSYSITK